MKIYIDNDYKCHTENGTGLREIETEAFEGKCKGYSESMRFVPSGETWTRSDGVVFHGEMISPSKDPTVGLAMQKQYESDSENMILLDDVAEIVDMIYLSDIEMIG